MPVKQGVPAIQTVDGSLRMTLHADPMAVRDGLQAMFSTGLLAHLSEDARGTAEIVLAEALNNIVEHAYAQYSGQIEVTLSVCPSGLCCHLRDTGLPMPDGQLPPGLLKPVIEGDLPEGGFGWFLIRQLAQDLNYRQLGGSNLLSFRLKTQQ